MGAATPPLGTFIVFEGGEGTGKSTQAKLLADERGGLLTREPGGTDLGTLIRKLLLDPDVTGLRSVTEILLMAADRAQHVQELIVPTLNDGQDVICDRYVPSSIAYQSAGRMIPQTIVESVNKIATFGLQPEFYILLDTEYEIARERLDETKLDRFEILGKSFHRRIFDSYRTQAAADPHRWIVVNANQSVETVQAEIRGALTARQRAQSLNQSFVADPDILAQALAEHKYDC